ncbi:MAG: peptidylprolyl isomerase [Methylibium sp.]|uniref:peptidylprolyl isomerase n=1 Tax=Methylibium sp. TaxID=2067992 RepID=UPI0018452F87|nr:peptidylprolyl isomerase [Methylibium sp.]MBA3595870.1 peptidylprolyl isomerase [Methylibium sp.]
MKPSILAARLASIGLAAALLVPTFAAAQNIATVNGKPVPKARADALMTQVVQQAMSQGQQVPPDMDRQIKDEVVLREIFVQEAEKRGLPASESYQQQMENARQSLLIRELFTDYQKNNPVSDADIQAEYDKFKAQASGKEYRARHILVDKEAEAKALIKRIKGGAKFEDVAKKSSKDTGSATNGGDLDWAPADNYVPEFSEAMVKLKKGEMTAQPVKSQFGWHILKLEDVREAQVPPLEELKPQIEQRLGQQKLLAFRDELKNKAKTDYKFEEAPAAAPSDAQPR